jgi:YVTN family beta-propeller protein
MPVAVRPTAIGARWRRLMACATLLMALSASVASAQGPVYVASGASVLAIDPATAAVQGTIPVGGTVTRVAATADGARIFASMSAAGTVAIVDAATRAVVHTVPVGPGATGLAVAPDGATLYVSTAGGVRHGGRHRHGDAYRDHGLRPRRRQRRGHP